MLMMIWMIFGGSWLTPDDSSEIHAMIAHAHSGLCGMHVCLSQLRTNESGEAKLVSVLDLLICCWVRLEFSLGIGLWDGGWEWCFLKELGGTCYLG